MTDTDPEETRVLRDVDFLYVNLSRGPDGITASTVVRDRSTGRLIEVPGGPLTVTRGRQHDKDEFHPPSVPVRVVPPEHRVCRERTEEEEAALRESDAVFDAWIRRVNAEIVESLSAVADIDPVAFRRKLRARDLLADPTDDED